MDKLSDLELCKKIAEIEGKTGHEYMGEFVLSSRFNEAVNDSKSNSYSFSIKDYAYNPLTDDALCFQLMKKHDIDNSRVGVIMGTGEELYCAKKHDSNAELAFSRSRNKVILLAIVEANNG